MKSVLIFRFWYDVNSGCFEDVKDHIYHSNEIDHCPICSPKAESITNQYPEWNGTSSIRYKGEEYHVNDFVYIADKSLAGKPYHIGQISSFINEKDVFGRLGSIKVNVRMMKRYSSKKEYSSTPGTVPVPPRKFSRLIYLTNCHKKFPSRMLEGKCTVKHRSEIQDLESYKEQKDCFFYLQGYVDTEVALPMSSKALKHCSICIERKEQQEKRKAQAILQTKKLVALDIFSGCGGLSSGLKQSGIVDTKYAIEFNPSAALTYK